MCGRAHGLLVCVHLSVCIVHCVWVWVVTAVVVVVVVVVVGVADEVVDYGGLRLLVCVFGVGCWCGVAGCGVVVCYGCVWVA